MYIFIDYFLQYETFQFLFFLHLYLLGWLTSEFWHRVVKLHVLIDVNCPTQPEHIDGV